MTKKKSKGKKTKKGKVLKRRKSKKGKKEDQEMKYHKSQIFSIDTMVAMVIFIAAITGLLVYIGLSTESEAAEDIKEESEIIPKMIATSNKSDVSLLNMNRIDKDQLSQLAETDYEELKSKFGVKHDFCIYFEDSNGNLVNLTELLGEEYDYVGIGSPDASVAGVPCGTGTS